MRIEYYMLPNGSQPAKDYIDALEPRLKSKTMRSVALLKEFGTKLRMPESRHLQDGIFELRTVLGGNSGRVLYFFFKSDTAILTHGFIKKTRKTPLKEIARAKAYRSDYEKRCGG